MGICRARRLKHRLTGGRMPIHKKKKKHELGRPPANTKLGSQRVRPVRCRGGNLKYRALRLDTGSFSWASESITRVAKINAVVYNATNHELVRTNTLTKNTIVQVDATPFRTWYQQVYGVELKKEKVTKDEAEDAEANKDVEMKTAETEVKTEPAQDDTKHKHRKRQFPLDPRLKEFVETGRILACISSRPGQVGRIAGYILEGKELEFYKKKMEKKKKK